MLGWRRLCSAVHWLEAWRPRGQRVRPRLLHWEEVEGSPADTGRRARKLMELRKSTKSSVWWGSKTVEESGFGWEEWGGRGLVVGKQAPEGLGFFQTIPRRLIASVDLYFHFFSLCLVLRQNSLSLHVMWMWILSSKTQHVIRAGWSKHVVQE